MFFRKRRHLRVFVSPRRDASVGKGDCGDGVGRAGIIAVVSRCGIRGKTLLISGMLRLAEQHVDCVVTTDAHKEDGGEEKAVDAAASGTSTGSSVTHELLFSPFEGDDSCRTVVTTSNDEFPTESAKSNHRQCLQRKFCYQQ